MTSGSSSLTSQHTPSEKAKSPSQPVSASSSWKTTLKEYLPSWIPENLNKSSMKLLFRCWVAAWVAWILIVPSATLRTFGNAAFFIVMASIMVPPALPVQLYFMAMTTIMVGALFGWAWGCAAMKASLTARDQILLLSQIQRARQTAASSANPDAEFQLEVFQGVFLNWRSSLVYGAFLGVGAFFFGVARAASPRLALFSVFGTIFLDVICSIGPLFPAANYLILKSFLISTAAAMGIGCVTIVLIFPQTLNHAVLGGISRLIGVLRKLVDIQESVLTAESSVDLEATSQIRIQIQAMLEGAFGGIQKLMANAAMLSVEFSYGRFNGEDVRSLIEPLGILINRIAGLQNLAKLVGRDRQEAEAMGVKPIATKHSSATDTYAQDPIRGTDGYVWKNIDSRVDGSSEEDQTVQIKEVFPPLHSATADLRKACSDVLRVSEEFIVYVNSNRWRTTGPKPSYNLDAELDTLRRALDAFKGSGRMKVVEPFKHFTAPPQDEGGVSRRMLFYALVFEANLVWVAEAILGFAELLAEIAGKHTKSRLWAPKSFRSLWKILLMSEEKENASDGNGEPPADPVKIERSQMVEKRDPDSEPPSNLLQHFGQSLYLTYDWCRTPSAIYAFKYTFITIAVWLPAVFRPSAFFYYSNKGLWALIMAQTTLEPYIADQIFSYFNRLTATSAGILLGLVGWYIGAGNGPGNPYGVSAVMAVILLPIIFWRVFSAPNFLPSIMCGVTIVLVIGYSWIDARLHLVGSPGVGWSVGWRRWLLVLIGSGASAIMLFIPPKSARKAIRVENASNIFRLSQLYGMLISEWIVVEEKTSVSEQLAPTDSGQISKWSADFRKEFTKTVNLVQTVRTRTTLAKWEGSFRGAWPVNEYRELGDIQVEMLSYLAQLAGAVYHLDPVWRKRLLHRTKFLNPDFISEVMSIFSLVSRALRTGEPLQETLPKNLLDRVAYHHRRTRRKEGEEDEPDHWAELNSVEYMNFAAGVSAVYQITRSLDRLHQVTVKLCGEVQLRGFAEWRELYSSGRFA